MSNLVILCNESGLIDGKAPIGQHATLAYICAAVSQGHTVFVIDHSRDSLKSCVENQSFPVTVYDQSNFGEFVSQYQEHNSILADLTKNAGAELLTSDLDDKWSKVADRNIIRVKDIAAKKLGIKPEEVKSNMIGREAVLSIADLQNSYVLNRLDPMLASFTERDRESTDGNVYQHFLAQYKALIPDIDFSDSTGKCDKIAPEEVDETRLKTGLEPIYTPTSKFTIDGMNSSFKTAFETALAAEENLFPKTKNSEFVNFPQRIIFKPIDSAQSSGVCGIEFRDDGINLEQLRHVPIMQLISEDIQLLHVKKNLSLEELAEITQILLYAQSLKEEYPEAAKQKGEGIKPEVIKELSNTSSTEISEVSKKLYETDVLIQPFLIGVAKMGDVRVNVVADADGNWSIVGHTFRAQISKEANSDTANKNAEESLIGSRFTTCFSTGKAAPTLVEYMLSKEEYISFDECTQGLLWALNGQLKQHYAKCQELGVDLVPVGDGKNFKLGEINHADPALTPVSAALRKGAYDLALEIQKKPLEQLVEKERNFLQNYEHKLEQEKEFVLNRYQGGLGPMIESLNNAIIRQDRVRLSSRLTATQ